MDPTLRVINQSAENTSYGAEIDATDFRGPTWLSPSDPAAAP